VEHVRILLVEDDVDWLEIYREQLQYLDYELVSTRTVDQALGLLSRQTFAVIVADLRLFGYQDEFSGFEVLRRAKIIAPDTLVITITAYGSRDIAMKAQREGAFDYITKPIDSGFRECVHRAVQTYLQKAQRQPRQENKQIEIIEYLDFDILVTPQEIRVFNSPAGQAKATPAVSWVKIEEQILFRPIGQDGLELPSVREFGMRLFRTIVSDDVKTVYDRSREYTLQDDKGLRIRIRTDPGLLGVPWEFLYDPTEGDFLALSRQTPIVRFIEMPRGTLRSLRVEPPLRLLVVSATPIDLPPVEVETEKAIIQTALDGVQCRGDITIRFVDHAKPGDLFDVLREDYHILHFIGHGSYDPQEKTGTLILEDERGDSYPVDSQGLSRLIRDARSLRLAMLNICHGATIVEGQLLSSLAGAIVQTGGVPAVIAMQFPISNKAAEVISREFYCALSEGYPVDTALAEARKRLDLRMPNDVEWATAALYMRSHDGRLFNIES
jgi:CheY-like chemotaxis protein